MNSGSSASSSSAGQSAEASAISSWYQTSRPSRHGTSLPVRRTTMQVWVFGHPSRASWVFLFSGTLRPPRGPSSAVITTRQSESRMRSRSASGEKPPNTTECTAPIRAHASIATIASGTIGM